MLTSTAEPFMKTRAITLCTFLFFQLVIGGAKGFGNGSVLDPQKTAASQDTTYILDLNRKAELLRYQKSDSIGFYAEKALRLSEKLGYEKGVIYATSNLALHELYQGNTEGAIAINEKNVANKALPKYPEVAIKIYNDLAQAHFVRTAYPESYKYFRNALDIAEATNETQEIIRINSNLGTMFSLLEDYEEALNYYGVAQRNITGETQDHVVGAILSNLGHLKLKDGNYIAAISDLNEGLKYFVNSPYSTIRAFSLINLAEAHLKLKQYEEALVFFKKAQTEYEANLDKKGTADLFHGLSTTHMELGDYDKALEYAQKSLQVYTAFNLKTGMERCYRNLYEHFKREKVLDSSLYYLELAETFSDSIAKTKNKANILMLRSKMDFEAEKERIKRADLQTINQQKAYIRWTTASLVVALAMVLFILQSNKRKKELNRSLEEKAKVLSQSEKILCETNTTKDKLFSIIGHDLRGPIVSLRELVALSLEDKTAGESYYKKFAPALNKKLDSLQFTLDNLLNWGQTQMSGATVNAQAIFVRQELQDSLVLFREKFVEKSIKVINKVNENDRAFVDANHFAIIFRNLVSNAIKFTHEKGTITIDAQETNNSLIISISDNGIGMDQATLNKVWDNQEHHSTYGTSMEKGTGLGLSLCKEMVEKNKGNITVESEPGKGTTFFVSIPTPSHDI